MDTKDPLVEVATRVLAEGQSDRIFEDLYSVLVNLRAIVRTCERDPRLKYELGLAQRILGDTKKLEKSAEESLGGK